jgi:hypothetical protein
MSTKLLRMMYLNFARVATALLFLQSLMIGYSLYNGLAPFHIHYLFVLSTSFIFPSLFFGANISYKLRALIAGSFAVVEFFRYKSPSIFITIEALTLLAVAITSLLLSKKTAGAQTPKSSPT